MAVMALKRMFRAPLLLLLPVLAPAGGLPRFSLSDTAGRVHTPADWVGKRAAVLLFVSTDCPLSNRYVPEMNRIASTYGPRGVVFYAVQGDATVPLDQVRAHVKE